MTALVAFEAAARHQSFKRAAEELFVTPGAISHQVKALETELGVKLFSRLPQRLELTVAGRAYFAVARDALDRVAFGTDELLKRQSSGILTVSTSPNFASKWLVHRLGRFTEEFSDIDLRLSATKRHVDFARDDVDLAIRHGDGSEQGLSMVKLYQEQLFPVCSPDLLRGRRPLNKIENIKHHPLLHLETRSNWSKWFSIAGVEDVDQSKGLIFDEANLVIDACVAGQGVGLARTGLAAQDLLAGRLVRPFDIALPVDYAYWIVCPIASEKLPKIQIFRDWLLAEAANETRLLDQLGHCKA